jgi:hypothetical protein
VAAGARLPGSDRRPRVRRRKGGIVVAGLAAATR